MVLIARLLTLWRERLAQARRAAEDPHPIVANQWLWRVRARILHFLVSRYSDPAAARREQTLVRLTPPTLDSCLFEVQPVEAPPRSRERLGRGLRAIHQSNVDSWRSRRWRWFL